MNKGFSLLLLLFLFSQLLTLPARSLESQFPPAAEFGRYILHEDNYWIIQNKTVQQLKNEGYDVPGDPNWLLQVNYTRLNYTLKCTIVALSWPNVTSQNIEGAYNLNVTAHRIMEDGSIGERIASFLRRNQPARMGLLWKCHDPEYGVGYNPSVFIIGNHFFIGTGDLDFEYSVNRTETLKDTPWGQNDTYVLQSRFENASHSYTRVEWCDAVSGIRMKQTLESKTPNFRSYEEIRTIETGVLANEVEVVKEGKSYRLLIDTNSTLNGFEIDVTANKITVTVDGLSGTYGKCNVTVPKKLLPEGHGLEVFLDGQKIDYSVTEDSNNYYVYATYQHSSHTITISFVSSFTIWTQWWFWSAIAVGAVVLIAVVYAIKRRKTKTPTVHPPIQRKS